MSRILSTQNTPRSILKATTMKQVQNDIAYPFYAINERNDGRAVDDDDYDVDIYE